MVDNVPIARRLRSKATRLKEEQAIADNLTMELMQKNPLENPLIIDCVFDWLDMRTIKRCRLVCKKWNHISVVHMEKKSVTVLNSVKRVERFENAFRGTVNEFSDLSSISFQSFKVNASNAKWLAPDLVGFLEGQRQNIQELTINDLVIHGYQPSKYFSISPHIDNHLTHLTIDNCYLAVSVDQLTSTKCVSLRRCQVDVVSNYKHAPQSLELHDVIVVENKVRMAKFLVNDILRFENLKQLNLYNSPRDWLRNRNGNGRTELSINLSKNVEIDNLILKNVIVEDLKESKWKISKCKLSYVPFDQQTQMVITELAFDNARINLNCVPKSMEKLSLAMYHDIRIVSSSIVALPNLKYLLLNAEYASNSNEGRNSFATLALFAHCSNLTTVTLLAQSDDILNIQRLDTNWIPQSVKTLVFGGQIRVEGNAIQLDKVVVHKTFINGVLANLQKLKSNNLILDFPSMQGTRLERFSFKNPKMVEECALAVIQMPYDSVVIGSKANVYSVSKYANKLARHYLFENKEGRSVSVQEYREILGTEICSILEKISPF